MKLVVNVILAGGRTERLQASGSVLTTGRDPECSMPLPEDEVTEFASAVHAEFRQVSDQLIVTDLASTNGTLVNGSQLSGNRTVSTGDEIQLGAGGPIIHIVGFIAEASPLPTPSNVSPPLVLWWRGLNRTTRQSTLGVLVVLPLLAWLLTLREDVNEGNPVTDPKSATTSEADGQQDSANKIVTTIDDHFKMRAGEELVLSVLTNDGADATERSRLQIVIVKNRPVGHQVTIDNTRRNLVFQAGRNTSGTVRFEYHVGLNNSVRQGIGRVTVQIEPQSQPLDSISGSVACIGFRYKGDLHADETGWLATPNRIVTAGRVAGMLKELKDSDKNGDIELLVILGNRQVAIREITLHPNYEFKNPGARDSLLHDVAVLTLAESIDEVAACQLATPETVAEIKSGTELRVVGFINPTAVTELFDPLLVHRVERPLSATGSELPNGRTTLILKTSLRIERGLTGSPVFNNAAEVVGLLTQRNSMGLIVPAESIKDILK